MSELRGVAEMQAKLRQMATDFPQKVARAVIKEASIELTESNRRCPVAHDGGILRASGLVHEPVITGDRISVMISYGGAAMDYAVAVHEHLSEHSPPSWIKAEENGNGVQWTTPGTGPKFLESVLNESRPYMAARIAARIDLNNSR